MGTRDPRVDAYIAKSADFARPILERIREIVHGACPDVEETIKWGAPTFVYHGMLCGMAAFKNHAGLGFWKSALVVDAKGRRADESWGDGGRIRKLSDLPPRKVLAGFVKKAMALNETGTKLPRSLGRARKPLAMPADFKAALAKDRRALAAFEGMSASHRREYVQWVLDAKQDATRARRIATATGWIARGRSRNWKYERPRGK